MQTFRRRMSIEEMIERMRTTAVLRTYCDLQKTRISVENRVNTREFIFCESCGMMYPKPKRGRALKRWDGKSCLICGEKTIHIIEIEPNPILEETYKDLLRREKSLIAVMYEQIKDHPLWFNYLAHIYGIGVVLGTFLITYLHPARFRTISAMWKYCALHVEFFCPNCKTVYQFGKPGIYEHCPKCGALLIVRAPKRKKGEKVDWNPFARDMCWRIGETFAKAGKFYKALYFEFKQRIKAKKPDITPKHLREDAKRRVVKVFLAHWWEYGRVILGLPTRRPYPIVKGLDSYIPPVLDKKNPDEIKTDERIKALLMKHGVSMDEYLKLWDWFREMEIKVKSTK